MRFPKKFTDYPSAYDSFDDIPDELKLKNYENSVSDNTFEQFVEDVFKGRDYEHMTSILNAGGNWKSFCQSQDTHHALADPELVDEWCVQLLEEVEKTTADKKYLTVINKFYRYLKWHIEYPHIYNPVQFAAEEYKTTSEIWSFCYKYYKGDR